MSRLSCQLSISLLFFLFLYSGARPLSRLSALALALVAAPLLPFSLFRLCALLLFFHIFFTSC
jgi:hypothetical protein